MAEDPKNKLSEFGFGDLNPIEAPSTAKNIDRGETGFIQGTVNAIKKAFTPDAITGTGPYKAIVLRVEEEPDSDAGVVDWLSNLFDGQKSKAPTMVRIKAVIPELFPYPLPDGDGNSPGPHQQDIDHFPTFCAQSDLVPEPAVGDRVWVDFGNKNNFSDPIYLRPVLEKEGFSKALGIDKIKELLANAGCSSGLGVSAPSGDSAGGKNKEVSNHQGPPKGARATSEGEPKTIRGPDATERWAVAWEEASSNNSIPMISYFTRIPSNGMRDLLLFAPLTTDFSKPVELAYVFHETDGWLTPKWIGTEGVYSKTLQEMILDGRNIIFAHPKLPWAGEEELVAGASLGTDISASGSIAPSGSAPTSGSIDSLWNEEKDGGNLATLHGDISNILNEHFSEDIDISYVSLTAYGEGGEAVHQAASKDQLNNLKLNKITLGDTYGPSIAQPPEQVWDNFVSKSDRHIEYNLICEAGATSHNKLKDFIKEKLEKEVSDEPLTISAAKHTVNFNPVKKDHKAIAGISVGYVAPEPPDPPEASSSGVKKFGSLASLENVVTFGTSMMGTDVDSNGKYGKAMVKILQELGAKNFTHYGVGGSSMKGWLGEKSFPSNRTKANSHNPKLDINFIAGLEATSYIMAIGGNDPFFGKTEQQLNTWIGLCKRVLDTLSPDKTKPIVWLGTTFDSDCAGDCATYGPNLDKMYQKMSEVLPAEYPNLLILSPNTDSLKEIYYEFSRTKDTSTKKIHADEETHRRHLDIRLPEIKKFFGLDEAKQVPDDNGNASPEKEQVEANSDTEGTPAGEQAGICSKFHNIVEFIRLVAVDGGFGPETGHDELELIVKLESLGGHKTYIDTLKEIYNQTEKQSPTDIPELATIESAISLLMTGDSLVTANSLLSPKEAEASDAEAEQKRQNECATCTTAPKESGKSSDSSDGKSSPSERPSDSSTEDSSKGATSNSAPPKYLDLIKSESEKMGIEFELALAIFQIESARNSFCENGKIIVRFEPHIFVGHGTGADLPEQFVSQVPWNGCKKSNCKEWTDLGFSHAPRCADNYEVEFKKNMGAAFELIKKFGAPAHEDSVYRASSFGVAQNMGFSYKYMGYPSAKAMYEDFSKSEEAQIRAVFRFWAVRGRGKEVPMTQAFKTKDFGRIASYHNGCAYPCIKNKNNNGPGYATKLENEYTKLKSGNLPPNRDLIGDGASIPSGGSTGGGSSSQGSSVSSGGGSCSFGPGSSVGGSGRGGGGGGGGGTGGPGGTGPIKNIPEVTLAAEHQYPEDKKLPEGWEGWYHVLERTIEDVTHLVHHETAGNGDSLRSMRYVRDKGNAGGLLHHYIDFDGTFWNLVKYDAWGYHGNFLNAVSIGWEAVNPHTVKPSQDKFDTYRRIHGTELTRLDCRWLLKPWWPPRPWFEAQWILTQKAVAACPNLPMSFVGVRKGAYYPIEGKGVYSKKDMPPPGIIAHAYYFKPRGDGIMSIVYCALRNEGLSSERAWVAARERLERWGREGKRTGPVDVTAAGLGVVDDGLSPPAPPDPPVPCDPSVAIDCKKDNAEKEAEKKKQEQDLLNEMFGDPLGEPF